MSHLNSLLPRRNEPSTLPVEQSYYFRRRPITLYRSGGFFTPQEADFHHHLLQPVICVSQQETSVVSEWHCRRNTLAYPGHRNINPLNSYGMSQDHPDPRAYLSLTGLKD